MKIRNIHIVIVLLVLSLYTQGQNLKVSAKLGRDTLKIGEQTTYTLEVRGKGLDKITFPIFLDTLTSVIEIINASKVDTVRKEKEKFLQQTLTITCFDSGFYTIPAIVFGKTTDSKKDTFKTEALRLYVTNVPVDTSKAFKDIKNIASLPAPPVDYTWMWWLLLLIPIAVAVYYLLKMRKKTPVISKPIEEKIPAHIQALTALGNLEQEKLWQKSEYKKYHSRLTEIIRIYIEQRFEVPAMEHTSDQVLTMLKQSRILEADQQEKLSQMLHLADMVKFAKYLPIGSENELSMQNARNFVNQTAAKEQKPLEV